MSSVQPPIAKWRGLFIGLFVWCYLFFMSIFLFDSPQAEESIATNSLAWAIWSYPLIHFLAIVLSRKAVSKGAETETVRWLARLWWLNVVWFLLSLACIMLMCGGDLGCA